MIKRIEAGLSEKSLDFDFLIGIKENAVRLGLVGKVFTKEDGSIKFIAEGEEEDLAEFAEKFEKGNFLHLVENFYVVWKEPLKEFDTFTIIEDGK